MRKGEEVKLYSLKTAKMIYVPYIGGRKCRNVIGPYHLTLRYRGLRSIRNSEVTKIVDANDNT